MGQRGKSDSLNRTYRKDKDVMENVNVNHRRVVTANKRNQADTLKPKGVEAAREILSVPKQTDTIPPGSLMAPKTSTLFAAWNWVSPIRSSQEVSTP